ncbi:helix-turn-helix domain-containing protein [Paenibacillus mesotrionivorans]|uniref:Helix-turn-helix domain-containing protein n=1 Tax=Paenibacillus mesotrionivorans TaxID=3160968 RepID=A0ACC7NR47_9BACL
MNKPFTRNRKTMLILLKRCFKYFSLLIVLIAMITPLFMKSYSLAKQSTIEQSNLRLKEGMDSLEDQIIKAQEITNILQQEETFKHLFFLEGPPTSEYYVDMNTLQNKLKSLSLTQDMLSNVYIMFRDNPVFISNYISSDDYANVYNLYFNYPELPVGQFHDLLFKGNALVRLLPSMKTVSSYYNRGSFNGLTAIISNSYFNATDQKSVMAIVLDEADMIRNILREADLDDHFAYMADSQQQLLFSHNYADSEVLNHAENMEEITLSSKKYITLTYTTPKLGLQTVIGIPLYTFQQNVNAILELVTLYILIGAAVIVLLSVLFSMKETLWLKRLVEVASDSTDTKFNARNEYSYIDHAFTHISAINKEQLDKIDYLNTSVKNSVLKHLLMLGVYTEREKEEADSYFGQQFQRFCVAKVGFRLDESDQGTRNIQQRLVIELEQLVKETIKHEYTVLNFHSNEVIFVLFPEEEITIEVIKDQLSEMIRAMKSELFLTINVGLSRIAQGNMNAKAAYQQAKYAFSSNENEISSGVYLYEALAEQTDSQIFDMTLLLKLNDALIAGEKGIVSRLFEDSIQGCMMRPATEQQLQMFFLHRQAVYNAYRMIVHEVIDSEKRSVITIPQYDQVTEISKLFLELKQAALQICDYVGMNKRSNNERLKVDILRYIQDHHGELSLSASSIAEGLLISEKYVFSFIKEQTGKSLGKYIEEIRINNAERLLLETDYPNSKILHMCGFGSENTFYRSFAKRHAVSPNAWREMNRNLHQKP